MQRKEFNHLMYGQEARMAEMFASVPTNDGLMGKILQAQSKNHTKQDIQEAREEIAKHEVIISPNVRAEMDAFIAKQRELGTKERTIRRMVQRMFNIVVI